MSYDLKYPYTEEERINFIVEHNHQQGLKIETVDNFIEVEKTEEITEDIEVIDEETGEIIKTETVVVDTKKYTETINYPTYFALEAWEILQDGIVIDNTEEYNKELEQLERERISKLKCTKRIFALMLQEVGIDYLTMLKPLIESNSQAQLEWELCVELERSNPLLDVMAIQMGITSEHLDLIFRYANGELTDEQFLEMVAKIIEPEESVGSEVELTEPTLEEEKS